MNRDIENLDWSLLRTFLAVAETGSLSAAARATGQSQPTIGRQIKSVEAALGVDLFIRQPRGLVLNETGLQLVPFARQMHEAAARLALIAAGKAQTLSGVVRITASVLFSHHFLPEIISGIRRSEPEIQLELVASDTSENLLYREADVAIRMYPPTQDDIVARKLGELRTGLFAHKTYLERRGVPQSIQDMESHDFIGFDRETLIIDGMKAMGIAASRETFCVRCDQQAIYWELARAGCGIGVGQRGLGRSDPDMVQIMQDLPIQNLPVWLAAPSALRTTPRIRRVFDLLAKAIIPLCDA